MGCSHTIEHEVWVTTTSTLPDGIHYGSAMNGSPTKGSPTKGSPANGSPAKRDTLCGKGGATDSGGAVKEVKEYESDEGALTRHLVVGHLEELLCEQEPSTAQVPALLCFVQGCGHYASGIRGLQSHAMLHLRPRTPGNDLSIMLLKDASLTRGQGKKSDVGQTKAGSRSGGGAKGSKASSGSGLRCPFGDETAMKQEREAPKNVQDTRTKERRSVSPDKKTRGSAAYHEKKSSSATSSAFTAMVTISAASAASLPECSTHCSSAAELEQHVMKMHAATTSAPPSALVWLSLKSM
eukprot:gene25722-11380_t